MLLAKLFPFAAVMFGALIIDEKTGISIGTMGIMIGGIWWFGRKFQFFVDQFNSLKDFVTESKEWRKTVTDEQELQRKLQDQILRHQEQAKKRQELIMLEIGNVKEAKELYGELVSRMDAMKLQIEKK